MRQLDKYSSVILGIIIVLSWFYFHDNSYQAASAKDTETTEYAQKKTDVNKKPAVAHTRTGTGWWATCEHTAKLVNVITPAEREKIYASLLTQARQESPNSLELGTLLARYGLALLVNRKYELAVTNFDEAARIMRALPDTERKRTALASTLGAEGSAFVHLKKFDKAEICLRQAIAYAIAFPNIKRKLDLKKCYILLRISLENQHKQDEANQVTELLTDL